MFIGVYWLSERDLLSRVAQEVAFNHHKQLASDFTSDSYLHLAGVMDKLDFELKAPVFPDSVDYQLLGARYCSIQGNIAAQLTLRDAQGRILTLYITQVNERLAELHNQQQLHADLLIRNWREGALFFSLASPQG